MADSGGAAASSHRYETDEAHYDIPWEFIHRTTSFPTQSERPHSECVVDSLSLRRLNPVLGSSSSSSSSSSKHHHHHHHPHPPDAHHLHPHPHPRHHRNGTVGNVLDEQRQHSRSRAPRVTSSPNSSSNNNNNNNNKTNRVLKTSPADNLLAQTSSATTELDRSRLKLNLNELRERLNETGVVRRERYREEELVHHGVDRLEAERRLQSCPVGSFLVRMRDNGSLALSIRANKGILHIKLELRDNRWVLGEGPSFGSVSTVVSFYRSHELPIRGAERMLLSSPLLVVVSSSPPLPNGDGGGGGGGGGKNASSNINSSNSNNSRSFV